MEKVAALVPVFTGIMLKLISFGASLPPSVPLSSFFAQDTDMSAAARMRAAVPVTLPAFPDLYMPLKMFIFNLFWNPEGVSPPAGLICLTLFFFFAKIRVVKLLDGDASACCSLPFLYSRIPVDLVEGEGEVEDIFLADFPFREDIADLGL